ncbi:MAG: hypothetical protein KEFWMYNX_002235, partial [Candidatus Fervidibacter sp.]
MAYRLLPYCPGSLRFCLLLWSVLGFCARQTFAVRQSSVANSLRLILEAEDFDGLTYRTFHDLKAEGWYVREANCRGYGTVWGNGKVAAIHSTAKNTTMQKRLDKPLPAGSPETARIANIGMARRDFQVHSFQRLEVGEMKGTGMTVGLVTAILLCLGVLAMIADGTQREGLRERLQRNLLRNGDFEEGLAFWSTEHHWYARGEGLSQWEVDEAIVKSGKRSLKVMGKNNRGIAIQDLRPPSPTCRVS